MAKLATDILEADFLASASALEQLPPPIIAEVAFAGRSNVGKSSLINTLVARKKLVRTSSTPGCTRGINVFRIKLRIRRDQEKSSPAELDLVDLPGYGFARRSKSERKSWGPLIESFLSGRPGLRAVVVIVDVRRGPEPDDMQLIEYLEALRVPIILAATKLDKLPRSKQKLALQKIEREAGRRPLGFSAESRDGREQLWSALRRAAHLDLRLADN